MYKAKELNLHAHCFPDCQVQPWPETTTIKLADLETGGMKKNIHSSWQHRYSKCYDLEFLHSGFCTGKKPHGFKSV